MKRMAVVLLFACAAPAYGRDISLPVPPIPPAGQPLPAAPMPNPNIVPPDRDAGRVTVTIDSGINHREAPSPGVAFSPGAHYKIDDDRRWFVLPGIIVSVPVP
jgi:hypothetical protein